MHSPVSSYQLPETSELKIPLASNERDPLGSAGNRGRGKGSGPPREKDRGGRAREACLPHCPKRER